MTIVNSICENMKVQQQLARGLWDDHVLRPVARQPQHDVVSQVESHGGGTRWNPTQEQIEILEMLYARGMRTPNSHLIEQIALQLNKFGKIQGKNVFYWFQNHKARERQKLKRLAPSTFFHSEKKVRPEEQSVRKRNKCTSRALERVKKERGEEDEVQKTLELFPLHPEAK